jgi:HEAT repeat protein
VSFLWPHCRSSTQTVNSALWGPRMSSGLCDLRIHVLVGHTAKPLTPADDEVVELRAVARPDIIAVLRGPLQDTNEQAEVRLLAIELAQATGSAELTEILLHLAKDAAEPADVRAEAASAVAGQRPYPKSEAGTRLLPVPSALVRQLAQHRAAHPAGQTA